MSNKQKIASAQAQRYRFIEWCLMWNQRLNRSDIVNAFEVSGGQATLDITSYRDLHPGNVAPYDTTMRCYHPSPGFKPYYASQNPTEYLTFMGDAWANSEQAPLHVVPLLHRKIQPGILPLVMLAIDEGRPFNAIYASATQPIGAKRKLRPTALVYVAGRLHMRAYCETREDYRDFVLSRIMTKPKLLKKDNFSLPTDSEWEDKIAIKLIPNPALDEHGQALISREYGLEGNGMHEVRQALVHYFLQANLLPYSDDLMATAKASPWSFPVIPENWTKIVKAVFK